MAHTVRDPPVQDEAMWNIDTLQVAGIVLGDAEEVQVVAPLFVSDLKWTEWYHQRPLMLRNLF